MRKSADAASLVHDLQPCTQSSTTAIVTCSTPLTVIRIASDDSCSGRLVWGWQALLHSCLWFPGDFPTALIKIKKKRNRAPASKVGKVLREKHSYIPWPYRDSPLRLLLPCSERVLQYWRTTISPKLSQLPLVGWLIDWFWPTPIRQPLHSGADGLGGSIDFLARSFSAGLLLPFAAFIVGRVCFQSTKNSYKRVVLVSCN